MRCLTDQQVCIARDQALDFVIPVLNNDGTPTDLTGAVVEFGIATSDRSSYMTTLSTSRVDNVITAKLTSIESSALTLSRYYFSAWVTISGESTPVAKGYLTVQNDSRSA